MTLFTSAWERVSQGTLVNYFKKAGISSESQARRSNDDDHSKLLDAQLEDFQDRRESPPVDFTVDGYVDVDEDVLMSETHVMTDAEIIARMA